jgi:Lon protease-like protein
MSYCVSIDDVLPMVLTGEGKEDSRTVRGGVGCSGGLWKAVESPNGRYKISASATTSVRSQTCSCFERVS